MTSQIKYMDVVRLGHRSTVGVLNEGDLIVIQEKLDGANASFRKEGNEVRAFSRNNPVTEEVDLRGFYHFSQTIQADHLNEDYIYFGEWLVKHKLDYGENLNQFYLYDIYHIPTQEYIESSLVKSEALRLNLKLVPLFYAGEYISFDHLMSFVGRSDLGQEGEGVVVKNLRYKDRYGKQKYVKLVTDKFREVQKQKPPKDPSKVTQEMILANTFVRKGRVEKFLHKMVDEGILHEQFGIEDMGTILKHINSLLYDDILKEESDQFHENIDHKKFRQAIGKKTPIILRELL